MNARTVLLARTASLPVTRTRRPRRPLLVRTGRRSSLVAVLSVLLALVIGTAAWAYWSTSGSGTGSATAGTLGGPTNVQVSSDPGSGKVNVSWAAPGGTAPAGYTVKRTIGSTTATACGGTVTGTSCLDSDVPDGTYTYTVTSVLSSWTATSAPSGSVKVTNDATAPSTLLGVSPAPNAAGYNDTTVSVSLTASDSGSGVKSITYSLNNAPAVTVNAASTQFDIANEGNTTLTYFATDNTGNVESTHTATTFKIDKTKPSSTIDPVSSATWRNNGSVTITGTDDRSGVGFVVYSVDGANAVTKNGATASFVLAPGSHTVVFHAVDIAGNAESDNTATINVDMAAPTTTITPGDSTAWREATSFSLSGSDDRSGVASTFFKVDGADKYSTYGGDPVPLAEGSHTVTYYSTDRAGNEETPKTATLKFDVSAPSGSTITPVSDTTIWRTSNQVTITAGTDSGGSGVKSIVYKVDSGSTVTVDGTATTFTVLDGTHTITYYAVDVAGHSETPNSATIKVDTVRPSGSITFPTGSVTGNTFRQGCGTTANQTSSFDICGSAADAGSGVQKVEFELKNASGECLAATGSSPGSFTAAACATRRQATYNGTLNSWSAITGDLAVGNYTLKVWVTDIAGLESAPATSSFTR